MIGISLHNEKIQISLLKRDLPARLEGELELVSRMSCGMFLPVAHASKFYSFYEFFCFLKVLIIVLLLNI